MNNSHKIISLSGSNGYSINARFWKAGEPSAILVLLHGIVSHSLWLQAITEKLVLNSISCLAVDRRGSGLNESARGHAADSASLLEDVENVIHWADQFDVPVHLCGFCWGANYAVNFLDVKPNAVDSLIMLAPSLFPSECLLKREFNIGNSDKTSEEPVMPIECFTDGPAYSNFIEPDVLRLRAVTPSLNRVAQEFSVGVWMKLLRLKMPTQIILAKDDDVVDNNATRGVYERMKSTRKELHEVPGKHGIQFDSPDLAVTLMFDWISHQPE